MIRATTVQAPRDERGGPAPAPIIRLKKYFRYHFQLAAVNVEEILQLWREVDPKLPREKGIEYIIDVDPVNMR